MTAKASIVCACVVSIYFTSLLRPAPDLQVEFHEFGNTESRLSVRLSAMQFCLQWGTLLGVRANAEPKDAEARITEGADRLYLYLQKKGFVVIFNYRLNVFPIPVSPLRDRPEDIPLPVRHFVSKYAARMQKHIDRIPPAVMDVLFSHSWPGNIRELQNFIERSVILTSGNTLCAPLTTLKAAVKQESSEQPTTLEKSERDLICRTLKQTNGIIDGPRGAAARLGIKRTTLYSRMNKLGISHQSE